MTQIRSGIDTPGSNDIRDDVINESHIRAGAVVPRHIAVDRGAERTEAFLYDFAVQGGAQGAITLTDLDGTAITLPAKAIIRDAYLETLTTLTSGGSATVDIGITGNTDLFFDEAYDNAMFTAAAITAVNDEVPAKVGASAVSVLATIGAADLTAGKFVVRIRYTVGL